MKHRVPYLFSFLSVSGKCPQPCRNGGKCIGKSKCKCPKGYQGDLCSKRKYPIHIISLGYRIIKVAAVLDCMTSVPTACCLDIIINLSLLTYVFPVCRLKMYEMYTCKKLRHSHTKLNFLTIRNFLQENKLPLPSSFNILLSVFCECGASSLV